MELIETVVIDTDVLIDHLRGFAPARMFLNLFYENRMSGLISAVTVMELLSGKSASEEIKKNKIIKLLAMFKSVDVTFALAEKAAEIRRKYGTNPIDSLIAATAIDFNSRLVTCNVNHYKAIDEITLWRPYDK